jgi:class 3 adenylate cyclase
VKTHETLALAGEEVHAFLIADIRGFTAFTHEMGDEVAARLVRVFAALARESAEQQGGMVTELRGDEALAVFRSPRSALRAAVDLQKRCLTLSGANPHLPLGIGIGLDAGEAVRVEEGFRSGALNLASRLCSLAAPGEIFASEGLIHLARRVDGLEYRDCGEIALKGLEQPVQVFLVGGTGELPAEMRRLAPRKGSDAIDAARIVGIVGSAFGLSGVIFDRLFSGGGNWIALGAGLVFAAAALLGASRVRRDAERGSLVMLASMVGLVFAIGWWAVLAAVLLLVSTGMAIANR